MANDLTQKLHWAAGFLEGEGCFHSINSATVAATQVQREPLERLLDLFGGKIAIRKYSNKDGANRQLAHSWYIHGKYAAGIMMTIYSLMIPRRKEQIKSALNKWRIIPENVRSRYSTKCKRNHSRWGKIKYKVKSGETLIGRRCLECHRLSVKGLLKGEI